MKASSFGSRADGDLSVRATRNHYIAVGVENIVSDFRRVGLAFDRRGGVDGLFGSHGNLRASGQNVGLGMNFGARRMIVMFVHSVGRRSCRRRAPDPARRGSRLCARPLCGRRVVILDGFHLRHRDRVRRVVVAGQGDLRRRRRGDRAGERAAISHQNGCMWPGSLFIRARREEEESAECACKNASPTAGTPIFSIRIALSSAGIPYSCVIHHNLQPSRVVFVEAGSRAKSYSKNRDCLAGDCAHSQSARSLLASLEDSVPQLQCPCVRQVLINYLPLNF
ncbi:MAG: hypothetical protein DMG38_04945 [Acidobacteria bacterium]|nr:MAG: hypothetical protein DMG38_04945 [Acidobacteriota bacterium]